MKQNQPKGPRKKNRIPWSDRTAPPDAAIRARNKNPTSGVGTINVMILKAMSVRARDFQDDRKSRTVLSTRERALESAIIGFLRWRRVQKRRLAFYLTASWTVDVFLVPLKLEFSSLRFVTVATPSPPFPHTAS